MGKDHLYIGYPVPLPAFIPNPNPNPRTITGTGNTNRGCPKWFTVLFFLLMFAVFAGLIVAAIVWPTPVPGLRLNSLSVSGFNVSSFTVSGNWTASFTVDTAYKNLQISYSDLHAALYYQGWRIATAKRLSPLVQDTNSTANITAAFLADLPFLDPQRPYSLWDRIVYDRSCGSFKFDVSVDGNARSDAGRRSMYNKKFAYSAHCDNLPVEIPSNSAAGEFTGPGLHPCSTGSYRG